MEILICTDGSNSSVQSSLLISKLRFPSINRIVVLGVSENRTDIDKLNSSMDEIDKKLGGSYSLSKKFRDGNPVEEIMAEVLESSYDLVAIGGGGGQLGLLHPKLGSTASKLARQLHTHFIVARNIPDKIGKILMCVGGEAPASEVLTIGGLWISNTKAEISLLHVNPVKGGAPGIDKANGNRVQSGMRDDTSIDSIFQHAKKQLRDAGVNNNLIPHVRQGVIVEEVLLELAEGKYELLVIGAHYQPGQDRWQETLLDDVTDQLINRSNCSVLII